MVLKSVSLAFAFKDALIRILIEVQHASLAALVLEEADRDELVRLLFLRIISNLTEEAKQLISILEVVGVRLERLEGRFIPVFDSIAETELD